MASLTSYKITNPLPMKIQACITCAAYFAVTEAFDDLRYNDSELFYCPAGHGQRYFSKEEREITEQKRFSVKDYAENAVLKSQVEYLSRKLKEAVLSSKVASTTNRKAHAKAGSTRNK